MPNNQDDRGAKGALKLGDCRFRAGHWFEFTGPDEDGDICWVCRPNVAELVRPERLGELGDFITALFEWGTDDPHDQAEEIVQFLASPVGLESYREAALRKDITDVG